MNSKLRIGLLLNNKTLPAWAFEMIVKAHAVNEATTGLVIYNGNCSLKNDQRLQSSGFFFYELYRKFDKNFFQETPDAFEPKDAGGILAGIPTMVVTPVTLPGAVEIFNEADLDCIKRYDIDVFIKIGFGNLTGEIHQIPKYGIWGLYNSNQYNNTDGIAGVHESFNNIKTTDSILHVLPGNSTLGRVLYYSKSMTNVNSVNRNANRYYWKALNFAPRMLNLLAKNGETWFWNYIASKNYNPAIMVKPRLPGNYSMPFIQIKMMFRIFAEKLNNRLFIEQWQLWISYETGKQQIPDKNSFIKLVPPVTHFWADPHLLVIDKKKYIFFEELSYKTNLGHLSVLQVDDKGNFSTPVKILEKPYHLSYPFVMEYQGDYYMIPETSQNKNIQLYKSSDFPYKWDFVMNLMENIHAVDTTIFFYDNTWWLFANMLSNKGISGLDELFVFYSNAENFLTSDWISHCLNPVISDVTRARPAGALFEQDGKLYRPSQSSTTIYGTGVNINEVKVLNTMEYKEVAIETTGNVTQNKVLGMHSFSKKENLTVMDALLKRFRY